MIYTINFLFSIWIIMVIGVRCDDFPYDYFVYKSVQRLTIFSCDQTESNAIVLCSEKASIWKLKIDSQDDIRFLRRMNDLGISVNIIQPQSDSYDVSDYIARKDNWPLGILLDTRCQSREINEKIFLRTAELSLYDGIHVWLILASNFDETTQLLDDSSYSSLSDLVLAIENENGYELYDVYNPCKRAGGTLNITKMGFWDPENGLDVVLTQDKFYRRSNLHGLKVKVGTVAKYQRPGVSLEDHLQDHTKKSEDPVSKYGFEIIRELADLYNFTMDLSTFDEWVGTINGTEKGLMVQLSMANVDIGASPCSANSRFAAYGRVSMPGYPYRTFFLLRSNFEKLKWTELLTPLAVDSWYATGLAAVLAVLIISTTQMTEYGEGWITEIGHGIFAITGLFCQQGLVFVPNRIAGRVALLFLLFFGVLLFNYYGASVVSARLSEPPDKMNDSLYSLAKSEVKVASEPFFVVDDNLNSRSLVDWEVRYFNEKVWKKLSVSRFVNVEEGLSQVAKGGYAYHTSAEVAYPYVDAHWDDKAICDMTEVHVITPRVLSFYERADSPFTEMLKIGLIKTANMGLQQRTVKLWKPKAPYCSPLSRSLQSISIFEIAPAIILMLIGATLALIIFHMERVFYKMQPKTLVHMEATKIQRTGGKKTLLRA